MSLIFNISEIAIITGDNKFKKKRDYLIDFWKRNNRFDYDKFKKMTQFTKNTDQEIIQKICEKNNINISNDLDNCVESINTDDLNTLKRKMVDQMDNLTENDKKQLTESVSNIANSKFGIKNEFDITKLYQEMTGNIIFKDDLYHKIKIYELDDYTIYIAGKIDGINIQTGTIIEVKNRINKLFYNLRDYEKVQITCYMFLFKTIKGHLVEGFRKKDGTDINIIEVDFEKKYMDYIIDKIVIFSKFYSKFIKNDEMKLNILKNNDEIEF
jgi:hypothetical protein